MSNKLTSALKKKRNVVKHKIESEPKVYWFLVKDKEAKVLIKGDTESETKKELKKLVKNGIYDKSAIWKIEIRYYPVVMFGRVSISINNWTVIDGVLTKKPKPGKVGVVWLVDDYLDVFGWKKRYITSIIKGLTIHKKKLNSALPNLYSKYEDY